MELQHINVRLFLEDSAGLDLGTLIPIFHGWIQEQLCEDLLIDVADYRHVFEGPGVVLIGHEADYSVGHADHRTALRYNRKAITEGTNARRLRQALRAALTAAERLSSDQRLGGKFCCRYTGMEFSINDRLLVPNVTHSLSEVEPEFRSFLEGVLKGRSYSLHHDADPRRLFSVGVQFPTSLDGKDLLKNL